MSVTQTAGIDQMAAKTSFSNTMSCVDLGSLKPKLKGGYSPRLSESMLGSKRVIGYTHSEIFSSILKKKSFHVVGVPILQTTGHTDSRANFTGGSNHGFGLGQLACIEDANIKSVSFGGHTATQAVTTYGLDGTGVADIGSGSQRMVLTQQHIEFKIKNISSAGDLTTECPCYISCYWVELKEDVHMDITNIDTAGHISPLQHLLENGFMQEYDLLGTDSVPVDSADQNYYINWNDNTWLRRSVRVLDQKSFVLLMVKLVLLLLVRMLLRFMILLIEVVLDLLVLLLITLCTKLRVLNF